MELSLPNRFEGKIVEITRDSTLTVVTVENQWGVVSAAVTTSETESMDLKVGDDVAAVFRALDVTVLKV
jgi:molybdopterin-binding protein